MSNIAYLPCAAARPFMRSCSPTFNHTPSPHDHPLPFLNSQKKSQKGRRQMHGIVFAVVYGGCLFLLPGHPHPEGGSDACSCTKRMSANAHVGVLHAWCYAHATVCTHSFQIMCAHYAHFRAMCASDGRWRMVAGPFECLNARSCPFGWIAR